ncbi:MAG: hypothetical protein ACE14S_08750 [Candidatus Bathyarchaeia archaeon]
MDARTPEPSKQEEKNDSLTGRITPIGEKKIALIAHDAKKADLLDWARFNKGTLPKHELYATGTTGKLLKKELCQKSMLQSRPSAETNKSARCLVPVLCVEIGWQDCLVFSSSVLSSFPVQNQA